MKRLYLQPSIKYVFMTQACFICVSGEGRTVGSEDNGGPGGNIGEDGPGMSRRNIWDDEESDESIF